MSAVLLALTVLSLALLLWQWFEAWRFPLHRSRGGPGYAPALTLLKPLKGCDAETARCLESWLAQDYPGPWQVLFIVASAEDPVVPVVRRLMSRYPHADLELVACAERLGPNSKVSKLAQAAPRAKHEILVVSDADVEIPPGFLSELVAPLSEERVVLVNPFYQLANATTPAMHGEALAVNADFWSSVLQARRLGGLRFALGAVMALRRESLERLGGFAALVHHLADDYELGRRLTTPPTCKAATAVLPAPAARAETTRPRIELCPTTVACRESPRGWLAVWRHQLRWNRTIRYCQPLPYALSLVSNPTLWPLLWLAVSGGAAAWTGLGGCLLCRLVMAAHCQWRLTRSWRHLRWLWLAPVKDLLQAALWALALTGNTVEWRGERYRVLPGGTLQALARDLSQSTSPTIANR